MQNNPTNPHETDEALASRAKAGDREAFEELTKRHYDSSLRMAMYMLRRREAAEDEVQTAYGKAFQNIALFREEAKFTTWITRIVLNCCLMRIRREQRAKVRSLEESIPGEETFTLPLVMDEPSPEAQIGHREILDRLRAEMRRIPPMLRSVIELRDIKELSMEQVAGHLGISVPAAKSRLLRARQELRHRMDRHCVRNGTASLLA